MVFLMGALGMTYSCLQSYLLLYISPFIHPSFRSSIHFQNLLDTIWGHRGYWSLSQPILGESGGQAGWATHTFPFTPRDTLELTFEACL